MLPFDLRARNPRSQATFAGIAQDAIKSWIGREIRARRRSAARGSRHSLTEVEWHHQVRALLAHVPNLESGVARELMLDRDVPLIRDRRLDIWIPHAKERLGVASVSRGIAGRCGGAAHDSSGRVRQRK